MACKTAHDPRPLVVHIVHRFDVGGLENGIVNLIDRMIDFRHAVVALTEVVPAFRQRVRNPEVEFVSLHKGVGQGLWLWPAMVRSLCRLRPDIVHTRNLAALDLQPAAWWAGVAVRIHGEHGRDAHDVDGTVRRYQWWRRLHAPFVHHWIALSRDLEDYLAQRVGIPTARISQIYNGVDDIRFSPASQREPAPGCPFVDRSLVVVGTVGRMQTVKAQPLLARAFVHALSLQPALRQRLRLVMVGDGPLRAECERILADAGVRELAWFAGERSDVPALMRGLDLFVLPSLAEGISNTILEAMASALPVVATDVGGNADLVGDGVAGQIVPAGDVPALAQAIAAWAVDEPRRRSASRQARSRIEQRFNLEAMVEHYRSVYRQQLQRVA